MFSSELHLQKNDQEGAYRLVHALHQRFVQSKVSGLEGDGSTWKAVPQVARSKEDVLATAGSRYTYSANPLAYADAIAGGAERIALVGMGCQASAPPGCGATSPRRGVTDSRVSARVAC